jgi:putative addiction module antidote
MYKLKVRKIGNSLGVTLPKEALAQLDVAEGDEIYATGAGDSLTLTASDETFGKAMEAYKEMRRTYRNALGEMAK